MLAPLSPHEETALRKIGFASGDSLAIDHVRRLAKLELIQWDGSRWNLTELGWRRFDNLGDDYRQQGSGRL
jgi:hypothetical protein